MKSKAKEHATCFHDYPNRDEIDIAESTTWKNIIFFPFNLIWKIILLFTIIVNQFRILYILVFETPILTNFNLIYVCCEMFYMLDTILLIMHRTMSDHNKLRAHAPKNFFLLILDFITIFPVLTLYKMLISTHHDKTPNGWIIYTMLFALFRYHRVFTFFAELQISAGFNQIIIICCQHFMYLASLIQAFSCIWYYMSQHSYNNKGWIHNLANHKFDRNSSLNWQVISIYVMGGVMTQNCPILEKPENIFERGLMCFVMLFGVVFNFLFLFANFVSQFLKQMRQQYTFLRELQNVKLLMNDWNMPEELKKKTVRFYDTLWTKRRGYSKVPEAIHSLPITLQMEVNMDIFWEAFRHSHLFSNEDTAFKRALSMKMKSEFYIAGHTILKTGDLMYKLIYIVSGVVQILSAEDDDSQLISLSSGTLLGETACLIFHVCNVNIKTVTYTEVFTLSLIDLYKSMYIDKEKIRSLRTAANDRILFAKNMRKISYRETQLKKKYSLKYVEESQISWVKKRWKLIHLLKESKYDEQVDLNVDVSHTSKYLNLLVLSEENELNVRSICLTNKIPFIYDPDSSFRQFWDYVSLLSVFIHCFTLPYMIVFGQNIPYSWMTIKMVCDGVYFTDFVIQSTTAIRDGTYFTIKWEEIIFYRGKNITYLIDFIASIPIDYLILASDGMSTLYLLFNVNRLFKVYKLTFFFTTLQKKLSVNFIYIRIVKFIFIYILITYWLTCIMFFSACPLNFKCREANWFKYSTELRKMKKSYLEPTVNDLVDALFAISTIFWGVRMTEKYAFTIFDMCFFFVLSIFGYFLYLFCISQLSATFLLITGQKNQDIYDIEQMLKNPVFNASLPTVLKKQVTGFMWFQINISENHVVKSQQVILRNASQQLYEEIVYSRIINTMRQVEFLNMYDDIILKRVAHITIFRTVPPRAYVLFAENKTNWLHVIVRGKCRMTSTMKGDKHRGSEKILESGDAFPLVESLHNIYVFLTVQAITTVEVLCIPINKFRIIIKSDPILYKELKIALEKHMAVDNVLLNRKEGRLPPLLGQEVSLGRSNIFDYSIYDKPDMEAIRTYNEYITPFKNQFGKWSVIRFLLFPKTINATTKKYLIWETIRTITCIIQLLIIIFFYNIFYVLPKPVQEGFIYGTLSLFCIDIYIRLHIQYYNEIGLPVTHPLYTAKYYLTHAFVTDLVSVFPYLTTKILNLFGSYTLQVEYFVLITTRFILIFRVFKWFDKMGEFISITTCIFIVVCKYCLLMFYFIGVLSTANQFLCCRYKHIDGGVQTTCDSNCWLIATPIKIKDSVYVNTMISFVLTIYAITRAGPGIFHVLSKSEVYWFLILVSIGLFARIIFVSKSVGSGAAKNVFLLEYRHKVKRFLQFVYNENVDEEITQTTINYYEHWWRKSQGFYLNEHLSNFHPQLQLDCAMNLFYPHLKDIYLFDGVEMGFFRRLVVELKTTMIMKDFFMIRCNDVQSQLFILFKGEANVIVANTRLCILGKGSIFGNISKFNMIRQKINVQTLVHSEFLVIQSCVFMKLINDYPILKSRMEEYIFLGQEYIPATKKDYTETNLMVESRDLKFKKNKVKYIFYLLFFRTIDVKSPFVKFYYYITSVYFAPFCSIWFICISQIQYYPFKPYQRVMLYIFDVSFLLRIYIGQCHRYIHSEWGIAIKNIWIIRKQYFLSIRKFGLDLISVFPFELIAAKFSDDEIFIKKFTLNRALRFFYLFFYYKKSESRLEYQRHIKYIYLLSVVLLFQCIAWSFWWNTACAGNLCAYIPHIANFSNEYDVMKNKGESVFVAMTYVVNLFSMCGLRDSSPISISDLIATIYLIHIFQGLLIFILRILTYDLILSMYMRNEYEHGIEELYIYLKDRELSQVILGKVWSNCVEKWHHAGGSWLPLLIIEAPSSLKQDLMYSLYGMHLERNYLFAKTHINFLKQLVCHLNLFVYRPGEYIVETGDTERAMYFIHNGEVDVYEKEGKLEILVDINLAGASFGEAAGIYQLPHFYTYKARTIVDILVLRWDAWQYLLDFFPASKEEIEIRAIENNIQTPKYDTKNLKASSSFVKSPTY